MDFLTRENIAIGIAAVSLALSLAAFWRQNRATGRAHFTAEWADHSHIVLLNHGPGPARSVEAALGDAEASDLGTVPYVGALQRIKFLQMASSDQPAGTLHIRWKDNRRAQQSIDVYMPAPPKYEWPAQQPRVGQLEATVRAIAKAEVDEGFRRATRGF